MKRESMKDRTVRVLFSFDTLGWTAVAFGFALLALMAFCNAGGCSNDHEARGQDDWVQEQPYAGFAPGPSCPAPSSPHAAAYQDSGGASNAWMWWMALHALSSDHGYYEPAEMHHHHYYTRPSPAVRYARAPHTFTPPPRIQTNLGVKPVTAIKPAPVQSRSYGYKPNAKLPASINFKSSTPTPVRPTTTRPRTR